MQQYIVRTLLVVAFACLAFKTGLAGASRVAQILPQHTVQGPDSEHAEHTVQTLSDHHHTIDHELYHSRLRRGRFQKTDTFWWIKQKASQTPRLPRAGPYFTQENSKNCLLRPKQFLSSRLIL